MKLEVGALTRKMVRQCARAVRRIIMVNPKYRKMISENDSEGIVHRSMSSVRRDVEQHRQQQQQQQQQQPVFVRRGGLSECQLKPQLVLFEEVLVYSALEDSGLL